MDQMPIILKVADILHSHLFDEVMQAFIILSLRNCVSFQKEIQCLLLI